MYRKKHLQTIQLNLGQSLTERQSSYSMPDIHKWYGKYSNVTQKIHVTKECYITSV
jgi:hypothetical protein